MCIFESLILGFMLVIVNVAISNLSFAILVGKVIVRFSVHVISSVLHNYYKIILIGWNTNFF